MSHANAPLTPAGRLRLIQRCQDRPIALNPGDGGPSLYNADLECTACGSHLANPHQPTCPTTDAQAQHTDPSQQSPTPSVASDGPGLS